jgi:hypothetical protein
MVHVGLNSVGTYHKKFDWENKINKNVLCRVSRDDTRQRNLKTLRQTFAECLSGGTRQRHLCRVSGLGHSTKSILN